MKDTDDSIDTQEYLSYHVSFTDSLEFNSDLMDLIDILANTKNGDVVNLYLGSPGGDLYACIHLINSIKDALATVNIIVRSPCQSGGSFVAISGDTLKMEPGTFLMFHNYNATVEGKGGELHLKLSEMKKWSERYIINICSPFLTKKEIKDLFDDKDLYIHYDDKNLQARINRINTRNKDE